MSDTPSKSQKIIELSKCEETKVKGFFGWEEKEEVDIQGSYASLINLLFLMSHMAIKESSPPDIKSQGIS